ncbi:hypothetical protein M23134_05072 [Microscilla marina ATCC 23134]|uniref:Uncharacterized protein n=1 Tax=Microscilla marina ATCC 23134 TaxID=313606 RepID=A1ZD27_MICM2|nr:hypothetical protein M23134_05072 [Microscilla marina ATCC 23134]
MAVTPTSLGMFNPALVLITNYSRKKYLVSEKNLYLETGQLIFALFLSFFGLYY